MAWTMAEAEVESRASQEGSTGVAVPPRWKMTIVAAGKFDDCGTLFRRVFFFLLSVEYFCSCHVPRPESGGIAHPATSQIDGSQSAADGGDACMVYTVYVLGFRAFFHFLVCLSPLLSVKLL